MKRGSLIAGLLALGLILGGASTWEGSAIVGGSDDFPDNGLYGACNSFPHNTTVVVTNLETGKSVTVLITQNVDNPGVFIALSPRAASSLGMQVGTAARVRAVASLGSPESSLPPTRTGETSDPDFNPRVFMDRDRAAQAAASGAVPAAGPTPAAASPSPSAAQVIEAAAGSTPAAAPAASAATPPAANVAAAPAAPAASTAPSGGLPGGAAPVEKPKADLYPPPAQGGASPGSPRPAVIAGQLPKPDAAPIPSTDANPAARSFPASRPELEGGSRPQPRTASAPRLALADPEIPKAGVTVDALSHPAPSSPAPAVALVDPELGPETLPDEDLPRVAAPSSPEPDTHLAEIDLSNLKIRDNRPESLAIEKPAAAAETAEAASLGEPVAISPAAQQGPEKGALDRPATPALVQTAPALQEPGLAAAPGKPGEVVVGLEPTAPRPPSAAAASTAPSSAQGQKPAAAGAAAAQVPGRAVVVQSLSKGSYYVQLGVYGTNDALQAAVRGFTAYPLAVEKLEGKGGTVLYRLYVGPLSRDESGVVLIRIRSLGFKDAFLRTGT